VLLTIGAIFIMTWLYAVRDANPYGGGTHLLLAAGIVAVGLHLVLQRRNPLQRTEPSVGEHRASSTLLNPGCYAGLEGDNSAKLSLPKHR